MWLLFQTRYSAAVSEVCVEASQHINVNEHMSTCTRHNVEYCVSQSVGSGNTEYSGDAIDISIFMTESLAESMSNV